MHPLFGILSLYNNSLEVQIHVVYNNKIEYAYF